MKNLFFIMLFLAIYLSTLSGQKTDNTDSLIHTIDILVNDTVKALRWAEVAYDLRYTDPEKSLLIAEKGLKLSKRLDYNYGIALANNVVGIYYVNQSNYDTALVLFENNLERFKSLAIDNYTAITMRNIAVIYSERNINDKALEYYFMALPIFEKNKDSLDLAMTLNNIGSVYQNKKEYITAISYFRKSYNILLSLNKTDVLLTPLNNIAASYSEMNKTDSARILLTEMLILSKQFNDLYNIAYAYNNFGWTYMIDSNYTIALGYLDESLKYAKSLNANRLIALTHDYIGACWKNLGNKSKAKENFLASYQIGKETNLLSIIRTSSYDLYEIHRDNGNYKLALEYYIQYDSAENKILNEENIKHITQLEMQSEFDKKQLELENKRLQEEILYKTKIKNQKIVRNFSIATLLLILIITVIILKNYKLSQKANREKESLLLKIQIQQDSLTDSIQYAKRIQSSMLPPRDILDSLHDNFILFKPRDIVSGDFYWFGRQNSNLLVCAADCTGHGVPGAFMSLLGIRFLNEIVLEKGLTHPGKILDQLRENVIHALQQKGKDSDTKDGMDISLCNIDRKNRKIHWAGAYNPLILVRNKELIEYKPDKMPIGIHDNMSSFSCTEISYEKGDCIYLFSDGYYDQFGGEESRKLMRKSFKETLIRISEFNMNTQCSILDNNFENWKKYQEQVDDVLVMGIRL